MTIFNFSAGPAVLPEEVLQQARRKCSTGTAAACR